MKKIIVRICIVVVVLIVIAALGVHFFLDAGVKKAVETIGPKLTKVNVSLDAVHISILSGSGSVKGLIVGNPESYKTSNSISVASAALAVKPGSLFADKLVIQSIKVDAPEINFEGGLSGNNLSKLLANLNDTTSGAGGTNVAAATPSEQKKANKKLEVDEFIITGAKLHATITDLGSKTITVTLPTISLSNLGTGPDGITAAELVKEVISAIEKESVKAVASSSADLGKAAESLTKGLGKNSGGAVSNVTQGIGNFFKKK